MRIKILGSIFVAVALAGCQSTISKYDNTYTGNSKFKSYSSSYASTGSSLRGSSLGSSGLRNAFFRTDKASKSETKQSGNVARPYFVEFRARSALSYGHVAVVFGELTKDGKLPVDKKGVLDPRKVQITGLHPATDSSVPWSVGHVVPVPAETGPSDGDFEEAYVTARYRINLTEPEFRRLVRIVAKHKEKYKLWYAPIVGSNCLGYLTSIAKDMGLKTPAFAAFPKEYVTKLKAANGNRTTM